MFTVIFRKKILRGRSLEGRGSYGYRYQIRVFFSTHQKRKVSLFPPRGGGRNFKNFKREDDGPCYLFLWFQRGHEVSG